MNSMPKYVVSNTLEQAEWNNSTVIKGELAEAISELKQEPGGELLVNGSAQLVHALTEHDLVDEYRLMIFPIVLGAGKRLFNELGGQRALRPLDSKRTGECLVLTYAPAAAQGQG
jgi:dihydrofolate reductase